MVIAPVKESAHPIQYVCAKSSESRLKTPILRAFATVYFTINRKSDNMTEIEITKENFVDEVLKSHIPVLIDFWAEWCGPCTMLAPVLEQFADTHDEIKVGKVNVDKEPELADTFNVNSIPALFALKDGEVFAQRVGYCKIEEIEELFKEKT